MRGPKARKALLPCLAPILLHLRLKLSPFLFETRHISSSNLFFYVAILVGKERRAFSERDGTRSFVLFEEYCSMIIFELESR